VTQEKLNRPLVPVADLRAAVTDTKKRTGEIVQIPDHNNCPPPNQLQTIGTAIIGILGTVTAWFKEDIWGFSSKRKKEFDEYKGKVDTLMNVHNKEEQERIISDQVEKKLQIALKQRAIDTP